MIRPVRQTDPVPARGGDRRGATCAAVTACPKTCALSARGLMRDDEILRFAGRSADFIEFRPAATNRRISSIAHHGPRAE